MSCIVLTQYFDYGVKNRCFSCCSCCLNVLIAVALGIPLLMMVALAVNLLHKGASTGGVLGIMLALIPGIISGIAVWLSKKILSLVNVDKDQEKKQLTTSSVINFTLESNVTLLSNSLVS